MKEFNKLKNNTQIICVIGHPIKHSYSPLMHNIAFELDGLNYFYLPFDVTPANLKDSLRGIVALGVKGFNVTLPHKEKIIPMLNIISEEASIIGAVNTVVNDSGSLLGYNTDAYGIIKTLEPFKKQIEGEIVSIIGAGGAARSAIFSLIRYFRVKRINIINRTVQKADSLREYFSTKMHFQSIKTFELLPPDLVNVLDDSKLIINTTSIGMDPNKDDSPTMIESSFRRGHIVFDTVYNPLDTKLLQIARSKEATTVNGLKMFVEQGAKSYELWTGDSMPVDKIYKTLESYLKK